MEHRLAYGLVKPPCNHRRVQQGDSLGPLLFCLTLNEPLKSVQCDFVTGYLDDVGLGDTVPRLIDQMRSFETVAASVWLTLNHSKCEIVGLDEAQRAAWKASGFNLQVRHAADAIFLGAPLSISLGYVHLFEGKPPSAGER